MDAADEAAPGPRRRVAFALGVGLLALGALALVSPVLFGLLRPHGLRIAGWQAVASLALGAAIAYAVTHRAVAPPQR